MRAFQVWYFATAVSKQVNTSTQSVLSKRISASDRPVGKETLYETSLQINRVSDVFFTGPFAKWI